MSIPNVVRSAQEPSKEEPNSGPELDSVWPADRQYTDNDILTAARLLAKDSVPRQHPNMDDAFYKLRLYEASDRVILAGIFIRLDKLVSIVEKIKIPRWLL
jgi:hypothetical protein